MLSEIDDASRNSVLAIARWLWVSLGQTVGYGRVFQRREQVPAAAVGGRHVSWCIYKLSTVMILCFWILKRLVWSESTFSLSHWIIPELKVFVMAKQSYCVGVHVLKLQIWFGWRVVWCLFVKFAAKLSVSLTCQRLPPVAVPYV